RNQGEPQLQERITEFIKRALAGTFRLSKRSLAQHEIELLKPRQRARKRGRGLADPPGDLREPVCPGADRIQHWAQRDGRWCLLEQQARWLFVQHTTRIEHQLVDGLSQLRKSRRQLPVTRDAAPHCVSAHRVLRSSQVQGRSDVPRLERLELEELL